MEFRLRLNNLKKGSTRMGDDASVFRTTVRIPTASGDDLEAWVYRPDGHGPHPAVVMAHGFAGRSTLIEPHDGRIVNALRRRKETPDIQLFCGSRSERSASDDP